MFTMRKLFTLVLAGLLPYLAAAQSDQHYTMFMYNKLLYNPAYAGSRDAASVNGVYRNQWTSIQGAPKTMNISFDAPVGNYMQSFRKVAAGVSLGNEKVGIESTSNLRAYYAYRIKMERSVVSFGLSAGAGLYSANYSSLSPVDHNDKNLASDVNSAILPNAGAGVYWSGSNFYAGLSVPNLLENSYDKNNPAAKQVRTIYASAGYVYPLNDILKVEPQLLLRYAGLGTYKLPVNTDINLSVLAYDRVMVGATYRTDKSFEALLHIQATRNINVGYAFDYLMSDLSGYGGGTHEFVVGYDIVRPANKVATPRFLRAF